MPSVHPTPKRHDRGSTLIAVVITVVVLSILLASVLSYASNTHRNSVRQTRLDRAKLVAESEMEYLFYRWISEINLGTASNSIAAEMITDGHCVSSMATNQTPFSDAISSDGWQVSRSIEYYSIPGTADGSAIGRRPGTARTGRNYYFTARVRASKPDPTFGTLAYRAGRRFVRSETSILQYSVFYQGDLEIASGSDMIINGPVSTNGSAFIGSQAGVEVTITDKVMVAGQFNGSAEAPWDGTTRRKVAGTTLNAPIFDPNPYDGTQPDQNTARQAQVDKLTGQENFVGGVNITKALSDYPDAYRNLAGVTDSNEVFRSIIAPPPVDGGGSPIPEDPTVSAKRMYNRAGIVVTIGVDGDGNTTVNVGNAADPTAFNAAVALHLGSIVPTDSRRKDLYDKREGRTMKVTSIDIGALGTALAALPTLSSAYNGVVYIHDETPGARGEGDGSAIRLTNAATLPSLYDAGSQPKGFAVVSNNGVYVQGDYNTTAIPETPLSATLRTNPAAILGDAVTLLSDGWSDDNAAADIYTRRADPAGASTTMTVNSAVLTGNTPSDPSVSPPINSGGVQNLVRLMEDWSGYRVSIKGSMGQLFTSKYMNAAFKGPSTALPDGDYVYWVPDERVLDFDADLARRPPAWTPTTTEFHRGDFFTWDS